MSTPLQPAARNEATGPNAPAKRAVQSVERSQLIILLSTVSRIALTLALTIFLGRVLGAADFGFIGLVTVLLVVARTFMELGTTNVAVRHIARAPADEKPILETLIGLRALLGLGLMAVLLGAALGQDAPYRAWIVAAVAAVVPLLSYEALAVVFQLRQLQGPPARVVVFLQFGLLVTCLLLYYANSPAWTYAAALAAREFIGILWLRALGNRTLGYAPRPARNLAAMKAFLRTATAFAAAAALYRIYFYIGPLLVWLLRSPAEMGAYLAAFRPMSVLLTLPWLLTLPLLPVLTRLAADNRSVLEQQAAHLVPLFVGLGAIGAVAGFELSRDALLLLYGDKYASGELSAVATLELLAVAFALTMATAAIVTLLVAEQREQRLPLVTFAGLVVNLACNVALLPANAFPAAAVATLATEACVFALGLLLLIRSPTLRLLRPAAILYLLPAAALALGFELIADDFGWQRLLAAFALCCLAVAALLQLPASRRARRQLAEHALAGARD